MKHFIYFIVFIFFFLGITVCNAQVYDNTSVSRNSNTSFIVRGSVFDAELLKPIAGVNVEVTGGEYAFTRGDGSFSIRVKIGDELVIRSEDFDPVYYTIKDKQNIKLEVHPIKEELTKAPSSQKESYIDILDQAKSLYKKDAAAAIDKVVQALSIKPATVNQRTESFELLGDIYSYWKQYDLAVTNYKKSLKSKSSISTEIALARAYFNNKNYQESIRLYQDLSKKRLNATQEVQVKEGLGDAYVATGDYVSSITNYEEAEKAISEQQKVSDAARINTKLGEAYDQQGVPQAAAAYFNEAAELSNKEKSESSIRAKDRVADFYSKNNSYEAEIELRKSAIADLIEVAPDSISNNDAITLQKQNYKIGNALAAQKKVDEAIPYFKKSISEAVSQEDLVVEKDARRRLSEVYRDKGDYAKAAEAYEAYKEVVDLSYSRKEQEISQAARFGKEIAEQQNRIISLEKDRELNENRYELYYKEQALAEERDTRQKIIIGSLALVAALLLLTAFAMYRSSKQQKYANNLLALKSLRSQMNPHFIFNALNSVNSFIATNDERTANRYLSDFSILMRAVLENSEEDFIPLSNEIDLIKRYTMLEHFRFKDRFDYTVTVDKHLDVDAFLIPPMLLQPYVENAVWHGMRYKEEKGTLNINFEQRDSDTAVITVTDDGVGRTKSKALKTDHQKKQKSQGMSNIKKRISILNEMYGDRIDVVVSDVFENGEGTKVTLIVKKA